MPGWDTMKNLLEYELTQSVEEGRDPEAVEAFRPQIEAHAKDPVALASLWEKIQALPYRKDFPFQEPSDLEGIRERRPDGPRQIAADLDDETLYDRLYGAWLGRCAGCALGKPVEGFMGSHQGLSSKDRIKTYLQAIDPSEYPLKDYFPQHSPAEERTGKVGCPLSTREQIRFMESDDDIRYTVVGQLVMRRKGKDFATRDVANQWISSLPYSMVCTAETQAYRNLVIAGEFHAAGWGAPDPDWSWIATNHNPYREWIGAQIRADSYGYAAPGNPELAAEFAWRDARLSHVKNGIYGEMLCAAMIAAAAVLDDPRQIVEAGLAEIPQTSRLYAEMRQTIDLCDRHGCDPARFEEVLDGIYGLLGHYHPVHTNNNAAIVIASLLLGGQDFEKAITVSVMGGWDSDCNGATVGSIAGAMLGARKLPPKWIDPLHDTLNSQIVDYHPIAISECARRSVEIAKGVLEM